MGKGLIPADPETWQIRRPQIVPAFHKKWLEYMVGLFGYCNEPLIDSLNELADTTGKVEMEEKFCSVALDIIGLSVFNYNFGSVTKESPVVKAVYSALVEAEHRSMTPAPYWDLPLYWKCIEFLEEKNIDYGVINVRSVTRMMLQKSSVQQMLPSNVRRLTMALTSKRKFEGDVDAAISDLAELSRESASAIYDVMSVIWLRTRNCKGLQWVHGFQAMKVLREVLLHGPLSAIAHATDGIQTIRKLAFRNSQGCDQIHPIAQDVFNLLLDRSRLVLRRRIAAEARRKYCDPEPTPVRILY